MNQLYNKTPNYSYLVINFSIYDHYTIESNHGISSEYYLLYVAKTFKAFNTCN